MYNANIPTDNELPSSAQLLISTLIALVVATLLLVTTVLPAEYGVDPTGIGQALGLKKMGEIKTQLAEEAARDAAQDASPAITTETAAQTPELQIQTQTQTEPEQPTVASAEAVAQALLATVDAPVAAPPIHTESMQIMLTPGAAAEVKVALDKSESVSYRWQVDTGHLNYDTHGDNPSTKYHNYNKGKAATSHEGELTAAFDGKHGWFWRNRSEENVTVTLTVSGDFSELQRVL